MNKIEYRAELRAESESRTITGKAISFETLSNDLGFVEVIHREAITQELIDSSNIVFTYNHQRDRILARRNKGKGNLNIDLRDDGVYFEFQAPNTTLGNDLLEDVRNGNISQCSFAFTIPDQEGAQKWTKEGDNTYRRDIYMIDALYDLSAVVDPAYDDTWIQARQARSEEFAKIKDELDKVQEPETEKRDEECIDIQENPETPAPEEVVVEVQEENQNEEQINNTEQVEETQPEAVETQPEPQIETKNNTYNMEKRFSILQAINSIASNQKMDEISSQIVSRGMQEMRAAGLSFNGQIQLPVSELQSRANVTVTSEGEDIIATQLFDIVTPLREKNVLVQAGAKFLTGLKSDIQIPLMTAANVAWATEVANATDGAPTFSNITLSPCRLTSYINLSKQLLVQDTLDVENVIRQDLIKAINHKLEATILGDAAGVIGQQPAGMLYNVTPEEVSDYAGISAIEADVECNNVFGDNLKWVVNPKFKAALRSLSLGGNVAANLYVNNEIAGTPALSTGHLADNLAIYGDFSNLVIGQWGAVDITVDPYTLSAQGMIRLVVNCYFDAKVIRPEAFGFAEYSAD